MVRKIVAAVVLMSLAGAVCASGSDRRLDHLFRSHPNEGSEREDAVKAPEIDPASASAALTLLAGGLAVLRGSKAKTTGN
jgi:hypothetical protein